MTLQWRRALATLFLCIASRPSPPDHSGFRHRLTSSGFVGLPELFLIRDNSKGKLWLLQKARGGSEDGMKLRCKCEC
nr:hypothetical protein Iba_chr12bCG2260 [Ipomoea batatas]